MRLAMVLTVLFLAAPTLVQTFPVPVCEETAAGTAPAVQQRLQLPDPAADAACCPQALLKLQQACGRK